MRPAGLSAEGGWGVFTYATPQVIPGGVYLGDDPSHVLTSQNKADILNAVGRQDPGRTTLDFLWNSFTTEADPDGLTGPKPLIPNRAGQLELHLGGLIKQEQFDIQAHLHSAKVLGTLKNDYRKIRAEYLALSLGDPRRDHYKKVLGSWLRKYQVQDHKIFIPDDLPDEGWDLPTTTLGDTFVETSDTNLQSHTATGPDSGFGWTISNGNTLTVIAATNQLEASANGVAEYRADSDLSGDDHFAQADVDASAEPGDDLETGLIVRKHSSGTRTYYMGEPQYRTDDVLLYRVSGGSFNLLANTSLTMTPGTSILLKTEIDGSTLKLFADGVEKLSVTDTNITGNLRCGIFGYTTNTATAVPIWDNWKAEDLGAPAGFVHSQAVIIG